MIPLLFLRETGQFSSPDQIRQSLLAGLHDSFGLAPDPGRIQLEGTASALESLRIDVSSGNVNPHRLPPRSRDVRRVEKGFSAGRLEIFGRPVYWAREAEIEWEISARAAELGLVHDARKHVWLSIIALADGQLKLRLREGQMEKILLSGARQAAADYGISVEGGRLKTHPMHGQSVRVEVDVQARKSLFKGGLSLSGEVSIDPNVDLRFRNVTSETHGIVAKFAKPFIDGMVSKWEEKPIPLLSEIFGEVQCTEMDVKFGREGALAVTAVLDKLSNASA